MRALGGVSPFEADQWVAAMAADGKQQTPFCVSCKYLFLNNIFHSMRN
jgi:hypothetical protein